MSNKRRGKRTAFPIVYANGASESGMTLHQYYVGQAIAGFCANPSVLHFDVDASAQSGDQFREALVRIARSIADEMIERMEIDE